MSLNIVADTEWSLKAADELIRLRNRSKRGQGHSKVKCRKEFFSFIYFQGIWSKYNSNTKGKTCWWQRHYLQRCWRRVWLFFFFFMELGVTRFSWSLWPAIFKHTKLFWSITALIWCKRHKLNKHQTMITHPNTQSLHGKNTAQEIPSPLASNPRHGQNQNRHFGCNILGTFLAFRPSFWMNLCSLGSTVKSR